MSTWGASPTPPNVEAIKRENENLQSQVQLLTSELTTLKLSSVSMWCTGGRGLCFSIGAQNYYLLVMMYVYVFIEHLSHCL